jgi:hypothetical protein
MLTALVGLFGFCEHIVNERLWGWPRTDAISGRVLEHCNKCGATRLAAIAMAPNPKFDVPRFNPVGVEVSQEELVAMQAAASYNSKVRRIRRK